MRKILNIIIMLIIIIIILILLILFLNKDKEEMVNRDSLVGDVGQTQEITNEIQEVDNSTDFKIVENCIQQYYDIINDNSSSFYGYDDNNDYVKIMTNEEINQLRKSFLSEKYISQNNINLNNIDEYINTVNEKVIVIALQMKKIINTQTNKYLAQCIIINLDYEFLDEFFIYVNLDENNKTFSIEPIIDEFDNIDDIKIENQNEVIKKNDYNNYTIDVLSYEDIAKEYFKKYKMIILSKPDILYDFLDNEYKKRRFRNLENFEKYVEDNSSQIKKLMLKEYLVNNLEDGVEFVCKDQFDNYYVFKETLPMKFTLKLDMYTLITENFKKEYEKGDGQKRVQLCIDKFIKMINAHDYINAYDYLSDGFKNNYFNTQESFEEYSKTFFFKYNKLKYNSISEKGNNTYECKLQVIDLMGDAEETKDFNIIIQLKEDMSFIMLFDM